MPDRRLSMWLERGSHQLSLRRPSGYKVIKFRYQEKDRFDGQRRYSEARIQSQREAKPSTIIETSKTLTKKETFLKLPLR